MTEAQIVKRIVAAIRTAGGYAIKHHGSPYSHAGTPDVLGCLRGRMLAVEVKRPGGKPTALQEHELRLWAACGAIAGVVTSVDDLTALLDTAGHGGILSSE